MNTAIYDVNVCNAGAWIETGYRCMTSEESAMKIARNFAANGVKARVVKYDEHAKGGSMIACFDAAKGVA